MCHSRCDTKMYVVTGQRHADCLNLARIGSLQDSRLIKCLSIAEGG